MITIGMMMTRKNRAYKASLATNNIKTPDANLQAGARSTNATELNYRSVNTLDPSRLASAFANADQGYITDQAALFELVEEQDAHIFSELAKRRRAVTGLGWQLHLKDDATQSELDRVVELTEMLESIPRFEDAQYDLTDAIGKGFAALEIEWKKGSIWLPQAMHWVPQRSFQIKRDTGEMQYVKSGIPEALRPWGWVVHEHRAKSGYIEQSSLFRVLAWTYAYKAYNMRDMQRFLEVYGLPLRLGKYPNGIGSKQRDELLRAVRNIGNDGAGVVPSTMSIDFIQATKTGTVTDFLNSIEYWEAKQSKAILGGELDGKTTSEARIMLYDKVRREILLHDVRQIQPTLNAQIVKPIVLFNGMFAEDRMPVLKYDTAESIDQKLLVDVLEKAADMGMEIDIEWAHESLQIPRADGKGKILGKLRSPSGRGVGGEGKDGAALSKLVALAKENVANADIAEAYAAQLSALGAKREAELVQKIAAVVAEAGDFDEAIAGIEALAIDFNVPALAETIALGMTAAHLAGRADVVSE